MSKYKTTLIPIALFLIALAVRLPGLDVFFTADEFLWVDRSRNFLGGLISSDFECLLPSETETNAVPGQGLACTLRTGHPGVLTMWTGAAGITLEWLTRPSDDARSLQEFVEQLPTNPVERRSIAPVRLPTVFITALFVVALYWLVGKLFKPPIPLLAALLVALNPFHVALSRVLHHDALSTAFIVTSALSLIIYFGVDRRRRWLVLAGALAGVAMLSKSTGLFLIPYAGLLGLWAAIKDEGRRRKDELSAPSSSFILHAKRSSFVWDGLIWASIAALAFFLLWPAMWVIPGQALNTIYSIGFKYASGGHAKGVLFFGDISQDPGPLFYPVMWFFRTNLWAMVGLLAAVVAGVGALRRRWTRPPLVKKPLRVTPPAGGRTGASPPAATEGRIEGGRNAAQPTNRSTPNPLSAVFARFSPTGFNDKTGLLLWIGAFILFFLIAMTLGEKKQDRYALPLYPMLDIVAACGLWVLARGQRKAIQNTFIGLILVTNLALTLWRAPYYFTYYNPLVGGIRTASKTVTIGWGDGLNLAAEYLDAKPEASDLKASSWYGSTFAPYFDGETIRYSDQKGNALAGDYVVFYINQRQRHYPDDEIWRYFNENFILEQTIPLSGVDYAWIFTGPAIGHYVEDQTYRGIGSLLGWDWRGAVNPDDGPVLSGSELDFSLFWEYLGKVPEEEFFARLIGPDDNVWAQTTTQPTAQFSDTSAWRQGQIIEEEGCLLIPAETPPGDYALQIGFYTHAPGIPSGELTFPTLNAPLDEPLQVISISAFSFPPPTEPAYLLDLALHAVPPMNSPLPVGHDFASPEVGEIWEGQESRAVLDFDLLWSAPMGTSYAYQAAFDLVDESGEVRWTWEARPLIPFLSTDDWPPDMPLRSQWHLPLDNPRTPGGDYLLRLRLLDETGQIAEFDLARAFLPGRERNFVFPQPAHSLDAILGEAVALRGVDVGDKETRGQGDKVAEGEEDAHLPTCSPAHLHTCSQLPITLYWQSLTPTERDYTVFVQLLDASGQAIAQQDAQPMQGGAPTSTWTPGEIIRDEYTLQLPAELPPGQYRLIAGMYLLETGERLSVVQDGEQKDFVLLWEGD